MKIINKNFMIVIIGMFFLSYAVINFLSYRNAHLLLDKTVQNNEAILHQEIDKNTNFIISCENNKNKIHLYYLKRNKWGITSSGVNLRYDSDVLILKSFQNNKYKTLLKNHKLLETYTAPAFGTLGNLRWYNNKSLLGTITTYTKLTFEKKENIDNNTIKRNWKDIIILE